MTGRTEAVSEHPHPHPHPHLQLFAPAHGPGVFMFGQVRVEPEGRRVSVAGEPAKLGSRAFDVLMALIERADRVVSKNELLDIVWPDLVVEENNLQVHVSALRKLLGPQTIATIPGRGYRFTATLDGGDGLAPLFERRRAPAAVLPVTDAAGNLPPQPPQLMGRDGDLAELLVHIEARP